MARSGERPASPKGSHEQARSCWGAIILGRVTLTLRVSDSEGRNRPANSARGRRRYVMAQREYNATRQPMPHTIVSRRASPETIDNQIK